MSCPTTRAAHPVPPPATGRTPEARRVMEAVLVIGRVADQVRVEGGIVQMAAGRAEAQCHGPGRGPRAASRSGRGRCRRPEPEGSPGRGSGLHRRMRGRSRGGPGHEVGVGLASEGHELRGEPERVQVPRDLVAVNRVHDDDRVGPIGQETRRDDLLARARKEVALPVGVDVDPVGWPSPSRVDRKATALEPAPQSTTRWPCAAAGACVLPSALLPRSAREARDQLAHEVHVLLRRQGRLATGAAARASMVRYCPSYSVARSSTSKPLPRNSRASEPGEK